MTEMTKREYWDEVASLAKSITQETFDSLDEETQAEIREAESFDEAREELDDRLWETIDGHQWVIYTAYNYDVLRHSDNDGYTIENWGADVAVQDDALNTAGLAFGALYADVLEHPDFGNVEILDLEVVP